MSVCPNCGTEYSSENAACPSCGMAQPVPEGGNQVECARCGNGFTGEDACPACGLAVAEFTCDLHPENVATDRCVLCRRAVCRDCRNEEKHVALCPDHRETPIIEGWAQVYSTTSELEGQLVRDNLRAEGLDAQVFSQKDQMFTLQLGELSIVRILVPVWEFQQALTAIRGHMDVAGEVAFACAECGEAYDTDTRECAACGATLPEVRR